MQLQEATPLHPGETSTAWVKEQLFELFDEMTEQGAVFYSHRGE